MNRSQLAEAEAAIFAAGKRGDVEKALRAVDEYRIAKLRYDAAEARRLVSQALTALHAAEVLLRPESSEEDPTETAEPGYRVAVFKRYKGRRYQGTLDTRTGEVETGGIKYSSPSPAAMSITVSNVNGWDWWRYVDSEGRERKIATLR
ncbi:MAG: DUF4357 domain-containing protein [Dehalococcoidia bacterium]|jgi:hypothetical protein